MTDMEPNNKVPGYRGPQVCKIVGITYRQLDYWARTDLLRPSISEAHGSGTQRRYSYRDLLELKVIKQLLDAGVSLQSARRAIECLRDSVGADLASANLVLNGAHSVLALVLPLAGVVEQLDAAITEFAGQAPTKTAAGHSRAAGGGG